MKKINTKEIRNLQATLAKKFTEEQLVEINELLDNLSNNTSDDNNQEVFEKLAIEISRLTESLAKEGAENEAVGAEIEEMKKGFATLKEELSKSIEDSKKITESPKQSLRVIMRKVGFTKAWPGTPSGYTIPATVMGRQSLTPYPIGLDVAPLDIHQQAVQQNFLYDLLYKGQSNADIPFINIKPTEDIPGGTNEAAVKSFTKYDFVGQYARAKKVTALAYLSTELIDDCTDVLYNSINRLINRDLLNSVEDGLLNGNGSIIDNNGQFYGIYTNAVDYSLTTFNGTIVNPNVAHVIYVLSQQAALNHTVADFYVINPIDYAQLMLAQNSNGTPIADSLSAILSTMKAVVTTHMPAGNVVVGNSSNWMVFSKDDIKLSVSQDAGDCFENNLVAVRAEIRVASYVTDTDQLGFVKGDIAEVKSALAAA